MRRPKVRGFVFMPWWACWLFSLRLAIILTPLGASLQPPFGAACFLRHRNQGLFCSRPLTNAPAEACNAGDRHADSQQGAAAFGGFHAG